VRALAVAVAVALAVTLGLTGCSARGGTKPIQVGVPDAATTTPGAGPVIVPGPDDGGSGGRRGARGIADGPGVPLGGPRPETSYRAGLVPPDGQPWRPAIAFHSTTPVPDRLTFVLVIGSDARPGERVARSRADSIHLVALNPSTRQGTILGFPRDSWVEIPGHGRNKINTALADGGPDLVAATVRHLTGLPVDYWVLTGFAGVQRMVDDLGGVDVPVTRRMSDPYSGARFERGWHHFTGGEALAFGRDRHDVAYGDFSRSENQGLLLLSGLAKLRAEVADDGGVRGWLRVLTRWASLDVPMDHLPRLATLARRIDPSRLTNLVTPGRVGTAGRASVVYLGDDAARLFENLRDDAVVGSPSPEPTTTTITSTSAPGPTPTFTPSPSSTLVKPLLP
jgi:LCP family protein required for cell wall assembly